MFTNGCLARNSVGRILVEVFTPTNDVEQGCIFMSTFIKSTYDCHVLKWNQKQTPPKVLRFSWTRHSYIRTSSDNSKVIAPAIHVTEDLLYKNDLTKYRGYQILLQNIQRHRDSMSYIFRPSQARKKSVTNFLGNHSKYFSCTYTNRFLKWKDTQCTPCPPAPGKLLPVIHLSLTFLALPGSRNISSYSSIRKKDNNIHFDCLDIVTVLLFQGRVISVY